MLEILLGIFTSSGAGAITGLIGALATKFLEYKTLGRKLEYEAKMAEIRVREANDERAHELALADKEIERAQVEGEIQRDVAEMQAFTESQKTQAVKYGGWVDSVRAMVRPFVAFYLLIACTILTVILWRMVGGLEALPKEQVIGLFDHAIKSLFYLATTAVLWYYGARSSHWKELKV